MPFSTGFTNVSVTIGGVSNTKILCALLIEITFSNALRMSYFTHGKDAYFKSSY